MIDLELSERVDALDDQRADDDGMTPSSATAVVSPRDTAEDAQARFAFLAESSRCLADSLDYETTLATVARLALPQFGT